jgi:hypothetical protein
MSKEMRQQMDTFKQRLTENLNVSDVSSSLLNEGKKYEFIDEHPSFKELNSKITDLKKFMKSIGKDLVGGIDYVKEHVEEKLFNK